MNSFYNDSAHVILMNKCLLTLQNNWRSAAGQINYDGTQSSYLSEEIHGFRAGDSWKTAVAISHIDTLLAKNQIRSIYDYISEEGMIPSSIYRDTNIQKPNFNFSHTPVSGWAIWEIYQKSNDVAFLKNKNNPLYFGYNNGIRFNFVHNILEVYFPLYSNNGWEISQKRYPQKIRFTLTADINSIYNFFRRGLL